MTDSTPAPVSFRPDVVDFLLAWQSLEVESRRVRGTFARAAGLSLTEFQALVFLSAGTGSPAKVVGEALGMTSGAMTALTDRVEKAGYVTRVPHPADRRSTLLVLTPSGRLAATAAGALYAEVAQTTLTDEERPAATALLRSLATDLAAASEAAAARASARPAS